MMIPTLLKTGLLVAAIGGHLVLHAAPLNVLINPGDQGEKSRYGTYQKWESLLKLALKGHAGGAKFNLSLDASAELPAVRARNYDIIVAPSHIIGAAVRFGYTPVLGSPEPTQAVLVAMQTNPAAVFSQTKGQKLGLTQQDSVTTYLMRGEVNANNSSIKQQYSNIYHSRYQDALYACMQVLQCDVVAVEYATYDRWLAANLPVKMIMSSKPAPGMSVAVKDGIDLSPSGLRNNMMAAVKNASAVGPLTNVKMEDFSYISKLGYHTPMSLVGTTVVDSAEVEKLMQRGVRYFDTRVATEYTESHIPGAISLPYGEKSLKETDFDSKQDQFDVGKLGADKNAELIIGCGGGECWKSYKASQLAVKAGYKKIYWARGGFVDWKASGRKVAVSN